MNIKTIGLYIGLGATVLCYSGCNKKQQAHLQTKPANALPSKVDTLEMLQKQVIEAKNIITDSLNAAAKRAAKASKVI